MRTSSSSGPRKTPFPVEPVFVALTASAGVAVALVHGVALILRAVAPESSSVTATLLTAGVLLVSVLHAAVLCPAGRRTARRIGALLVIIGAGVLIVRFPGAYASIAAFCVTAFAQILAAGAIADRLRAPLAGARHRHPFASAAWAALGLALLVQSARLSTFMADPSVDYWLTTRDPFWAQHMCMPAYIEAADLQRQGVANVYDAQYYPVLTRSALPALTVKNMDVWAGDPFQYPPPFLLLPRLALALTDNFLAMRTIWYGAQLLLFLGAALAMSAWIGGAEGRTAALLIPAVWISLPAMQSLQYGQFHMAAVSLALLAMVAFERRRPAIGGALLGFAAVGKIFPGVLLLWLVSQRRWREAAWTTGMAAVFTLLAFAAFGPGPFQAFILYALPRLSNGAAFDFAAKWPEFTAALIADNLSPAGVVEKLGLLGVPGMGRSVAIVVIRLYTAAVIVVALVAGRRRLEARPQRAAMWLALLNLAALQAYGAWGDYVTLGTAWLMTIGLPAPAGAWRPGMLRTSVLVAAAVLFFVVPGVQPFPQLFPVPVAMVLTIVIAVSLVAVNGWVVVAGGRRGAH